jgi:hypothetical protein
MPPRPEAHGWRAAALALLLLLAPAAGASTTPPPGQPLPELQRSAPAAPNAPGVRIGIITMEPGEVFFERFGHNAIVVDDPGAVEPIAYNYGYFDMSEDDFFGNFIHGRMRYWLVALPLREDLEGYAASGRGVGVQWLDLPPDRAAALAAKLAADARGENRRYTYDYYTANCSTKVRDGIDFALDGLLHRQLVARSQGDTYRSESVRLATPAPWMALGFHLGLGNYADRPLSRWEEAFIPMRLREDLRRITLADGRPLVLAEEQLLPHRIGQPPAEAPRWRLIAFVLGLALAAAVFAAARTAPRLLGAGALLFWLFAGLAGTTMLFIWLGSAHVSGWRNQNLLLLSPLAFALLPGAWAKLRGRLPSPRFRVLLWIVVGMAVVAAFLKFLPFARQENLDWVLLFLPLHWALLKTFDPRPKAEG